MIFSMENHIYIYFYIYIYIHTYIHICFFIWSPKYSYPMMFMDNRRSSLKQTTKTYEFQENIGFIPFLVGYLDDPQVIYLSGRPHGHAGRLCQKTCTIYIYTPNILYIYIYTHMHVIDM